MGIEYFDEIHCQRLKVSGADQIEKAVEVTEQLKSMNSAPKAFSMAVAQGGANEAEITISMLDNDGTVLTGIRNLEVWCSDDSAGAGLCSTLAPDSLAAKASSGAILTALTANKHVIAQTNASGVFILVLTDAATGAGYVCVKNPITGVAQTVAIVTGSYGS